jgi:hypothetical protein
VLQILLAVMAVVLTAAVLAAGVSYVSFDAGQRNVSTQMASTGFAAWERAYTGFRMAYRAAPSQSSDLLPFLPVGGVKAPAGLSFAYGSDAGGPFVCLYGQTGSENDLEALLRLGDETSRLTSVPASLVSFGPACGVLGPVSVGVPLAVTYRLTN